MSFIKKYSILLIPVAIAIAAGVFVGLTVLTSRLLAKDISTNSVEAHRRISSLSSSPVSVDQAMVEKTFQDAREADVKSVESVARQGSMRELLNYRIFPSPKDSSQQLFDDYKEKYRAAIEDLVRSMKALSAPSVSEIEKEVGSAVMKNTASARSFSPARGSDYAYGDEGYGADYYNMPAITTSQDQTAKAKEAMLEAVCARRAEEIKVYANPSLFSWYDFWESFKFSGTEPAVNDCWFSQVAFWVYEDVVTTINKLNENSESVSSSPVKRLVGINFKTDVDYQDLSRKSIAAVGYGREYDYGIGGMGGAVTSKGDSPDFIFTKNGGVLGVAPWTGRICNDDIDVIHFSMGVVSSSSAVMSLMREVCSVKEHTYRTGYAENGAPLKGQHNQITILRSEVLPVDLSAKEHQYFRYGDDAVVRVDLICEYILPRAGYDVIKPETINVLLRQSQATPSAPEMNPGGPGPGAVSPRR